MSLSRRSWNLCKNKDKQHDGGGADTDGAGKKKLNELVEQLLSGSCVGVGQTAAPAGMVISGCYGFHIR